ncbi:DUF4192 domain-containing protein [Streptomyces sp. NPDC060194]|uniref:DUF4192 domain-containing protein n=1 Tax=Streptomyces sp. NPDC060194 TaxID=3347069 RepID=UPI0036673A2B
MTNHQESNQPVTEQQVTLRTPAELADALPYLLGFTPNDSLVLVAVHGGRSRFGGRLRIGIPDPDDWPGLVDQITTSLVSGSEKRTGRPDGIVAFLCQEPGPDETGAHVMRRLRPLAQLVRTGCGALDVPVLEALCISDGRHWSYCCPDAHCCPPEGSPLAPPGTSVMAAAATYAGVRVRGSLRDMEAGLAPWTGGTERVREQEAALGRAATDIVPRVLRPEDRTAVAAETLELARRVMDRLRGRPALPAPRRGGSRPSDAQDDSCLTTEEAARLILGLQDRATRDHVAAWMEHEVAGPALRLWRALARRCVGSYAEYAAAPLTLAGWVAWSTGDEPEARVALAMALRADPGYRFAQLLHHACNEGFDPEELRRCLRQEQDDQDVDPAGSDDPPAPRPEPDPTASRAAPCRAPAAAADARYSGAGTTPRRLRRIRKLRELKLQRPASGPGARNRELRRTTRSTR